MPNPDGIGLGLALTRRIVEAQGGHVGARSEFGKGSTFFAVLPRRFQRIEMANGDMPEGVPVRLLAPLTIEHHQEAV